MTPREIRVSAWWLSCVALSVTVVTPFVACDRANEMPDPSCGRTGGDGPSCVRGTPSSTMPERALARLGDTGMYAYNPHRSYDHVLRGSGHAHAAPDHSGIATSDQERRLATLPGSHQHDFAWLTAHSFVAPAPGGSSLLHMFGIEIYSSGSGQGPHVLAYFPDGTLADSASAPFGNRDHTFLELPGLVRTAGGLPALAHPSRYSPPVRDVVEVADLWGIELLSGSTAAEENAPFLDARLSAGKYTCITAGGDTHDDDYSLTWGYQVISSNQGTPSRSEIYEQVAACNFFVCKTWSVDEEMLEDLKLEVIDGVVHFSSANVADQIDFVGKDGTLLSRTTGSAEAHYEPTGGERYIRVEARLSEDRSSCYSQPIWLMRADGSI